MPAFAERGIFWPPADELTEAAERIRVRLGDWTRAETPWRICLTPPGAPHAGDVIVNGRTKSEGAARALKQAWFAAGAGYVEVRAAQEASTKNAAASATQTVRLTMGGRTSTFEAELAEDWLGALAAFLDCGFDPHDALALALAWRDGDEMRDAAWPVELARFPRLANLPARPAEGFARCPQRLGLYPVVPSAQWVERLVDLGVRTVQLRLKDAVPDVLTGQIARSVAAGRRSGAHVFVNDHWREAIDAGAYGVHLGQEDLDTADLGAIAAAGLRLGLSTHGYAEMLRALHYGPSYLACGAIFPTMTKMLPSAPQGVARLTRYVRLLEGVVPLVAIGGIDLARLPAVLATGVGSAAVVSAITAADDTAQAVAALQQVFEACRYS